MNTFTEAIYGFKAEPIAILVDTTLHRGYRDIAGVFTLEGDNMDIANESIFQPTELPDAPYVKCGRCFPNG